MKHKFEAFLLTMVFLIIASFIFFLPMDKKQHIQKCVEVTNYSAERCEWEITK
jgi:hypothetical protein